MNTKLQTLDRLELMNQNLGGNISQVQNNVKEMSSGIATVKSNLRDYEEKWDSRLGDMAGRILSLEKKDQSMDNKWDLYRESMQKNFQTVQLSIDSNS